MNHIEECIPPEPQQAGQLAGLGAAPFGSLGIAASLAARAEHRRQNPRFRTVWDAVEWLQKNHPEIDLDSPYQPPPKPAK